MRPLAHHPRLASLLALLALGCAGDRPAAPSAPADAPHVLLVSLDATRADHLGSYGYDRDTSPFLDALAARGRRFAHAFVNTLGTPPSHTTIFTSLYQETHRVGWREPGAEKPSQAAPDELVTLAEILRAHGYLTIAVTDGGFMSRSFGLDQGFERFADRNGGIAEGSETLLGILRDVRHDPRPRFVFLHTYEVHSPYEPPPAYRTLFGTYATDFEATNRNLVAIQDDARSRLGDADLDYLRAMYDGSIRYTDDVLRRLFAELDASDLLADALVVVTSDHGEEFGDHGGLLHRVSLHTELVHVPLVLAGPGVEPGVDDRLVSSVDLAPTILSAAGVPVPEPMEGRDLLAGDGADDRGAAVFAQYTDLLYSVRTRSWTLIESPPRRTIELYDARRDPRETENVAEAHPRETRRLLRRLRAWRESRPRLDAADTAGTEVPEEVRRRLEALGYVD